MGFLDGLIGNASEVKIEEATAEFARIIGEKERIEKAYKLVRDMFVFTNKTADPCRSPRAHGEESRIPFVSL